MSLSRPSLAVLLLLAIALVGCGGDATIPPTSTTGPRADTVLHVVTTVSPITSIVENIGGSRIRVTGIIPEGVNSHTFEPAPSVSVTLASADLLIVNGLYLEEPTLELGKTSLKPGTPVIKLGDQSVSRDEWQFDFSFPESAGHPNPHLWPDPLLGLKYAELVRDELSLLDPLNAEYFDENYKAFEAVMLSFDSAVKAAIATVPEQNRVLLTYHDSWAYFAKRYGMRVIGAVQPSDFTEPSARDVADLIDQIRSLKVPAIFGSEVFPSPVMEQIAREAGAEFVDKLRDDDLPGEPGDDRHSYVGLMLSNMEIMIGALGGDTSFFVGIPTGPVFVGQSQTTYPQ